MFSTLLVPWVPLSRGTLFAKSQVDQPQLLHLLPDLILVPTKKAGGFRDRPAVGEFVRQVTDIHLAKTPAAGPPGSPAQSS
jgi:hypothetical protein